MEKLQKVSPGTYLIGIVFGIVKVVGKLLGVITIQGLENFPHGDKRIIVVGNHPLRGEQFLLITLFFPGYLWRPNTYAPFTMADMGNYTEKFPWRLFRSRLISVNRTGRLTGVASLDVAADVLLNDGNIIMFPQGTRNAKVREEMLIRSPIRAQPIGPFRSGYARLVSRVPGTKTVPVYCEISWKRGMRFTIGKPITFPGGTLEKEITQRAQDQLPMLADIT